MKAALKLITISTLTFLLGPHLALALDPSLEISQYSHTSWTRRDGFSVGAIFAMAQTPDGYLWLGSDSGLYRFDGVRAVPWQPGGQHLRSAPYSLLVTRDGTLWIGTFAGLLSWNNGKLTKYPDIGEVFITSLLEDHEGTVWAGILFDSRGTRKARLCSIRNGQVQCYGEDDVFGSFVWSLGEDSAGNLWAGAESGLFKWKPGAPKRYPTEARVADMVAAGDGALTFGIDGGGLRKVVADKLEPVPIYSPMNRNALLSDREADSNKLLRDRDGGLWIGTHQRGLLHVHNGRTDVLRKTNGLSGDISCSLFEDREGNVWFASAQGLDRFRELPVATISTKQGLSSDATHSVVAATDGSIWAGTRDGLNRWKDGQTTIFRKGNGLPDDFVHSLFQDYRGRLWASTGHGLVYFDNGSFIPVNGIPSTEIYSITGDQSDNLWLSGDNGLWHLRGGRVVETFPWSALGRHQAARVAVFDPDQGGIWLGFWLDGGVLYFKDGQVRASYTPAEGLVKGAVRGLQLDRDGALWAATEGGFSRIKDGRVATLTTKNGLPCDTTYWSIEDNDHSIWLYTACGLVRMTRSELESWIADPRRRIEMTVWDAADGINLNAAYHNPPVAKSLDGRVWALGEGVAVLNPHNLHLNKVPPPVHVQQVIANHKSYWQDLPGEAVSNLRLPAHIRDLTIDYNALSFTAPEKIHFKYKLEGQDSDWREAINNREVQYSNLAPRSYRFRVIAANNSGVWNQQGDTLEFSVDPAYYQTNWFRALCALVFLALLWAAYQYRVRQLHHEFEMTLGARVGERTRIARELHDTLLQKFQGLLPRFQAAIYKLPEGAVEARETLEAAVDQASQAITEGRDAVQGLRLTTVEKNDLSVAIRTIGEELAADNHSSPRFEVVVEGSPRNLHPILRDEVYRITAEALRNSFRHAQARQIEVEIGYGEREFSIHVRDDGRGIDREVLSVDGREGHFGLHGMRERAELVGGKLVVWSEVESGTEVELSIPASKAYIRSARRLWAFRKLSNKDSDVNEKSNS
jgi:signal transduction histidine kinase/ligand-binding sensor domain-containing protein